jgi:hypothetical protein
MIHTFAYTLVFGKPVIMYGGIATYLLFLLTVIIALLNVKFQIHFIPFKWHPRLALLAIIAATLHAILGLSLYFNF